MITKFDKDGYYVNADTGERVVFYECDPDKNVKCKKPICKLRGKGDDFHVCETTLRPEYRRDGGRAFYSYRKLGGDRIIIEREYITEERVVCGG